MQSKRVLIAFACASSWFLPNPEAKISLYVRIHSEHFNPFSVLNSSYDKRLNEMINLSMIQSY